MENSNYIQNSGNNNEQIPAQAVFSQPKKSGFFSTKQGKITVVVVLAVVVLGAAGVLIANAMNGGDKKANSEIEEVSEEVEESVTPAQSDSSSAASSTNNTGNSTSSSSSQATNQQSTTEFGVANGYLNIPSWGIKIAIPKGFVISYRMEGDTIYITGCSEGVNPRPDYADISKNADGLAVVSLSTNNSGSGWMDGTKVFTSSVGDIYYSGSQAYYSQDDLTKESEIGDRAIVMQMLAYNVSSL